jgi:hypothetical protein
LALDFKFFDRFHYLVPGDIVDERVDHLPGLHEHVGYMDHQGLAEPLRVVILHDLYGRDVSSDVAVGVTPALEIHDADELLLALGILAQMLSSK